MNILSINTSTTQYSLAVMKNEILLGEYILPSGSTRFNNLMPSLNDLVTKVGLNPQELDGVIVALGPGSFTGIRIGLSVAKGLSESLAIPIVGVPTLAAMASQLPFLKEDICPLIGSRKGEVFTALFRWGASNQLLRLKEDTCIKTSEIGGMIGKKTVFIGNDLSEQGPILKHKVKGKTAMAPANLWNLKASTLGILGLKRLQKGESDNSGKLIPIYLRGADIRTPHRKSRSQMPKSHF
ncbi:MAG: tRNA (adenosine(37)-N6)-threonylcarbamoyltransferase complex dimerization subunit type 1 TsaB [Deltaproteobacteria bacterium]|nr:tRNA (adenosine(37)-N6)-threonylcarbamoyltransferase complex dimerization subunit type 1 TsaB [Deltaproteobacteria bacterium]MBW2341798.1 tRNA (adenosine(37)-N6)-threonylcarbamoyltransferase complex dimerization subunit type 1 TsaB [Deltaproteobacteria bacterium]